MIWTVDLDKLNSRAPPATKRKGFAFPDVVLWILRLCRRLAGECGGTAASVRAVLRNGRAIPLGWRRSRRWYRLVTYWVLLGLLPLLSRARCIIAANKLITAIAIILESMPSTYVSLVPRKLHSADHKQSHASKHMETSKDEKKMIAPKNIHSFQMLSFRASLLEPLFSRSSIRLCPIRVAQVFRDRSK